MYLVARAQISQLIRQKSELEIRRKKIMEEINELKSYASSIADGSVSIGELMKTPSSMYNRQLTYMNYSSQYCQTSAQNQLQYLMSQPYYQQMMSQYDPSVKQSYEAMMYQSFYKQSQNQFAKYEADLLHEKEKLLETEKEDVSNNLETCKKALEMYRQQAKEGLEEIYRA